MTKSAFYTWFMLCSGFVEPAGTATVRIGSNLDQAIATANPGDTIVLADGIYTPAYSSILSVKITQDITLRAENIGMAIISGAYTRRVMEISQGTVVLDGLVLTEGMKSSYAGGLKIYDGQVTLNDCSVKNNVGQGASGGGVDIQGGTITLNRCKIFDNRVESNGLLVGGVSPPPSPPGGGFYITKGSSNPEVSLNDCVVSNNSASSGAGLYIQGGTVRISSSEISYNRGTFRGGGLFVTSSCCSAMDCSTTDCNVMVTNTSIHHNVATFGAGALVAGKATTFSSVVFVSNEALFSGGGVKLEHDATLTDCIISDNSAADEGGGLEVNFGVTTISRTIVRSNVAPAGSGANVLPKGGILYYALPTVPGHWLPNANCIVNREACGPEQECATTREKCALTAGSGPPVIDPGNGWRPTVTVGSDTWQCQPPINIQPCDWKTSACSSGTADCLLGRAIYFTPYAPIDQIFPNPCAAGYLGSELAANQTSSDCKYSRGLTHTKQQAAEPPPQQCL